MNEQLLKDLVATAQQDNYNWDVVLDKFPELSEYDPQVLKDYVATVEKEDYNYEVANSKFPEFKFEDVESKDVEPQKEEALIEKDKTEEDIFVEMTQEELQQAKPTFSNVEEAKSTFFQGISSFAKLGTDLLEIADIPFYIALDNDDRNATPEERKKLREELINRVDLIGSKINPLKPMYDIVQQALLKRTLPPKERSIYENLIKEGNYAEAGKQIVDGAVSSAPSLVAARYGLPGLIALGGATMKGKFDENLKDPNIGMWQNLGNSLGSGTIEAVGEWFTANMIRKAGFGKSTSKEMATKILKGGYENLFKKLGVASVKEGFSEGMTSLASNIWDAFTLGKDFDWAAWGEQAFDEGIVGGFVGGVTTSAGALKSSKRKEVEKAQMYLTPEDVKVKQGEIIEDIFNTKNSIKNTDNKNDLEVLNNSLKELETNLALSQIEVNNNLRRMNEEELDIYAENIDKIKRANKSLKSKDTNTVKKAKDQLTKFNAENRRLLSEASKRRVGEQVETTEDLLGLIKKGKGKVKIANTPEEFQKLADETPEGKESKQDATQSEGFISKDGNIYINLTKAAEVGAVNVGSHELLHAILNNTLSDAGARSRIINEFKKTLTKNELALIEDRLNRNYRYETIESIEDLTEEEVDMYKNITTLKDGTNVGELKEEFYEEEYLNSFIDLIGDKKIRPSEGILNKIGEFLAPIFKGKGYKNIQFNTGKDVRKFLIDYQKGFGKKQLSEEIIKLAESGAEGRLITGEVKDSFKDRLSMSKTSSDRVQNFYESRGVEAANDIINEFKPIVNKIVQRRSEAPNFDRELLTSEIELGDRGLLDLIYNYNPESGVPLAAYINKFLPARAIEASRRVLGESFTEDVSERVDIAAPEVEVEVKTKKEKVPRSLRKKLNIEKGSDLYNKVKDAVVKTFGTKLPEVTDPKFKKALSDSYKRELKKEVNALMGNRSDFKMFVTNNAETLYKSIPQETINKRFQAFSEPVLDKDGKPVREKTAVGKGIFKKKPFNKEEFINYFLGEDVGASTKGTRKTALSETIADEMALDATLEVLEDPKVFEKFKEIQEIEGKKVPKDIKPKISEKVKRPEGFKFSNSQKNKIDDLDLSTKQEKTFVKRVGQIVDNNPGITLQEAINLEYNKIGTNKGFAYENVIIERLKALKIKGFNVSGQAGGNKKGISDFAATIFDNALNVEVKLAVAQYGDVGLRFRNGLIDFNENVKKKNYSFKERIRKELFEKADKALKAYRKRAGELGADLNVYDKTGKLPTDIYIKLGEGLDAEGVANLKPKYAAIKEKYPDGIKGEGFQKAITQIAEFDITPVREIYENKVPPTSYIQLQNSGLFFMGKNPLGLPLTELTGNVDLTLRVNKGESKVNKDGMLMTTVNLRVLPSKLRNIPKSDYTLDSASSVSSLMKTEAVKMLEAQVPAKNSNIKELSNSVIKFSKTETNSEIIGYAKTVDEALKIARDPNAPIKKIRVFDFDDTLATTKSDVLFTTPDGTEGKLNAEEFAEQGAQLLEEGYVFDFSEFNKVTKGKPGPLLDIAKKIQVARGTEDVFVLTARNPEAQVAIKEFLDSVGLNIPLENITGLGNSTGEAKANWMVEKAAEGYNDFYFADDALQNVEAVRKSMDMLDVKSKAQLVRKNEIKFSKTSSKKLNFKTDEAGNIKANFTINNKKYNINLDSRDNKGSFDVEFDLSGRIDITGTGDAVKVVRTVYNGLLEAIDQNKKIKKIEFSSLKSEPSRVRLYTTLMNSVAKKLGWNTDVWESNNFIAPEKSSYDFEITKPRKKQVAPVEKVLDVVDVKSEVQQAKIKFSKSVNEDFNKIIEQTTGIASEKVYSEAKAKVRGANKGNKKFFIPYSAEDFMGLIYPLLSKGKLGDSQMAWFKKNLLDPYAMANENIAADRIQLMEDFKALKKALEVPKDLRKKTDSGFTKEQAVRVYLFNKAGYDVPGISKTDLKELLDLVNSDGVLKAFGDQIFSITKGDGYAKPGENWLVGTITTDLIDVLNTVKRAKYLEQSGYTANAELIFSKENLNKLEAAYGTKYREAMENILGRMKSGKNRIFSGNRLSNRVLDYINNSTGAIMFFNTRSAVLQTISAINFLNWSFNNPIKAGAAFANQPQYWKDFVELINSDYLVDRRNGLKLNINESEIADAAATSKNKAKAAINYILQKGFLPTQFADSFAIAAGGATFYRNRIKDLIKNEGMSEADAKKQAMLEWRETAEVSQQSSDPSKISAQQASDLGRVILAFANTPMQYARIQKRALQDIVNGRGDAKTNVSKIIYYAVVQNLIFNALQSALFGLGFGDDEDDMTEKQLEAYEKDKKKKYLRIANGMLDSQLRGLGLAGATVAVIKNFLTDIYERSGRKRPEYVDSIYKLLQISPPVSSKISKIRGAAWQFDSKKRREEIFEKGFSIDNPAYEAGAKVISATVNIPLDRVYSKVDNISGAMDEDAETWQTVAMLAGWPKWQIMPKDKKQEQSKFKNGNVEIITFETSVKDTKKEVKKLNKTKPKRKKVKLKFK